MKRIAALGGAVVMIIVAIVIRSAIDDGGSGGSSSSGPITIACIKELETECRTLTNVTLRIEDANTTAKALAAGNAGIDGWVTFDPWPAMVNVLANAPVTGTTVPLASSPLEIAMVKERADALQCSPPGVTWKCLGNAIGRQWPEVGGKSEWGDVRVGMPVPTSASGALLLANAASGYFAKTDFATNDFDGDFLVWKNAVTARQGSVTVFLQQFPAAFSAVGTIKAQADLGAHAGDAELITPSPPASAVVVLTEIGGNRARRVTGDLTRELKAHGWDDPGSSGLPDAGVVLALTGLTR